VALLLVIFTRGRLSYEHYQQRKSPVREARRSADELMYGGRYSGAPISGVDTRRMSANS
jgi:hypothetical protein